MEVQSTTKTLKLHAECHACEPVMKGLISRFTHAVVSWSVETVIEVFMGT